PASAASFPPPRSNAAASQTKPGWRANPPTLIELRGGDTTAVAGGTHAHANATTAASTPPATTTVRHETATDATTMVTGIITPPIPTRIARRFMRIARSPGKRSDDSAFDAVFMPAEATPSAPMVTPASSGVRITASSGIANATSPDDSASDARYPSASTIGPDSRQPKRRPTNSAEISDPRLVSVRPSSAAVSGRPSTVPGRLSTMPYTSIDAQATT